MQAYGAHVGLEYEYFLWEVQKTVFALAEISDPGRKQRNILCMYVKNEIYWTVDIYTIAKLIISRILRWNFM